MRTHLKASQRRRSQPNDNTLLDGLTEWIGQAMQLARSIVKM
jgi:hypothetical protein